MRRILCSLSRLLLMLSWLLCSCTTAIPSRPIQLNLTDAVAFGGGFQVSGSACGSTCIARNLLSSSSCTCPASAPLPAFFEAAVDCDVHVAPSQAYLCFPGAQSPVGAEFGGLFQVDDISGACRAPNIFTMACSCPSGYSTWGARVLAISSGALYGTALKACLPSELLHKSSRSSGTIFGGFYQLDDSTPGGQGCRSPNVATGSCTCPEGAALLTSWRVLVDTADGGYIGSHIGVCGLAAAPPQPIQICNGQTADRSGSSDASAAIQACIDRAPEGAVVQLPPGVYSISNQLKILKAITLTSTPGIRVSTAAAKQLDHFGNEATSAASCYSASSSCATLRASAELYAGGGILFMQGSNISIQRIIIDGNRYNRLNTRTAQDCASGSNYAGHNGVFSGCDDCSFISSVTMFAVCGTGLAWVGKRSSILDSAVRHNGDHYSHNMWSDGLTLNQASPTVVRGNVFIDNSDINLILGSGADSVVSDNVVIELQNGAFGGIMLDNFNGSSDGNFVGMEFHNNSIQCNGRCDFGLELGPHPW